MAVNLYNGKYGSEWEPVNACVISTFRCNGRCHMCDIWKYPTKPEEEIKPSVLEKLPDGLGRINLTGGEPMLREDIEDVVRVLYKKCRLLEISTNGYYTDRIIRIAEKHRRPARTERPASRHQKRF
jgi:MoaA/NifB/PqqE/SkfB family radical SAM enzyme